MFKYTIISIYLRYIVIIIYKVPTDFFQKFLKNIFLYRNFYFCTEIYISVLEYILLYCCVYVFHCTEECSRTTDEYVCSGVYVFVLRDWYFFCTGAVICVLRIEDIFLYWSLYFCTEINISVLGYILFYWTCIFYCIDIFTRTTDEYVCVLRYRLQ